MALFYFHCLFIKSKVILQKTLSPSNVNRSFFFLQTVGLGCLLPYYTILCGNSLHESKKNYSLLNVIHNYHFSNTFERVQADSEKWWYYHLYTLVTDYAHRIPSPINLILRPPMFILYLLKRFGK